jgi:hypothetical protein
MPKGFRGSDLLASLFGFALMTAYWPGIAGAATTSRWIVAASLAIALFMAPRVRMTMTHWIGLVLIGWLVLTLLWNDGGADGRLDGAEAGFELLIVLCAFAVGSTMTDLRSPIIGAAVGIGVNGAVALAQWFGWQGVEIVNGGYPGLFVNRDRLAGAAALVAVALLALPLGMRMLPLVLPALVLAPARAAWLGVGAGLFVRSSPKVRLTIVGPILFAGMVWLMHHGTGPSGAERLAIWRDTIAGLTIFGHGLGSFRETFLALAQTFDFNHWHSRPEHPHNEWLWLVFEGGVPALGLGMLFALGLWTVSDEQAGHRGVFACLAVLSLFAMPFHDPATVVLGALFAGHCAGRSARLRDAALTRRMALRAGFPADINRGRHAAHGDRTEGLPVPAAVS